MGETSELATVLLLDDGELDRIGRMLDLLGVAYLRREGRGAGAVLARPSELLISSGRRAFQMPRFEPPLAPDGPLWVCYHGQDFLPLRDQLRGFGAHFLVSSAVDQETLRLFLVQLLRREPERRRAERLPIGARAQCRVGSQLQEARLVELSRTACRVLLDRKLAPGTPVRVGLPANLGAGQGFELLGQVGRSLPARAGQPSWSTSVVFDVLPPDDRAQLERILAGREIGTRVTPLASARRAASPQRPPQVAEEVERAISTAATPVSAGPAPPEPETGAPPQERRAQPRREYRRKVAVIELSNDDSEGLTLGFDLSSEGVRVTGGPPLELGMKLTLALYAGRREEPVVIEAVVLRRNGEGDYSLRFAPPTPQQRKDLARLTAGTSPLQALPGHARAGGGVVVARLIDVR